MWPAHPFRGRGLERRRAPKARGAWPCAHALLGSVGRGPSARGAGARGLAAFARCGSGRRGRGMYMQAGDKTGDGRV